MSKLKQLYKIQTQCAVPISGCLVIPWELSMPRLARSNGARPRQVLTFIQCPIQQSLSKYSPPLWHISVAQASRQRASQTTPESRSVRVQVWQVRMLKETFSCRRCHRRRCRSHDRRHNHHCRCRRPRRTIRAINPTMSSTYNRLHSRRTGSGSFRTCPCCSGP